jgi:hypothetical protein
MCEGTACAVVFEPVAFAMKLWLLSAEDGWGEIVVL